MTSVNDLLARIEALEKANRDKDTQLELLEAKVESLDETLKLKGNTIKVLKEHVSLLENKANRTEQYTMRPQLRINGIAAPVGDESNADVLTMVKSISEDLGVELEDDDIFRAHRVGKIYHEKKKDGTSTGKKLQSVIVRFRSWEKRCQFYRARPKKGQVRKKTRGRGATAFSTISLDLSKSTRDLVKKANDRIDEKLPGQVDGNCYAFADINCNTCIKLPGEEKKYAYFSNDQELDKILSSL